MTSRKPHIPMQVLEARQNAQRRQQAQNPANKLADKQNRWQRFNRFGWDKRQAH